MVLTAKKSKIFKSHSTAKHQRQKTKTAKNRLQSTSVIPPIYRVNIPSPITQITEEPSYEGNDIQSGVHFIWCSHGTSITPEKNNVSHEYKLTSRLTNTLKGIRFYVSHGENLALDNNQLSDIHVMYDTLFGNNTSAFITVTNWRTRMPSDIYEYNLDSNKKLFLPPVFFSASEDDLDPIHNDEYINAMGLYRCNFETNEIEKILTVHNLIDLTREYNVITYAHIIDLFIKESLTDVPLDMPIHLHFITCRAIHDEYAAAYPPITNQRTGRMDRRSIKNDIFANNELPDTTQMSGVTFINKNKWLVGLFNDPDSVVEKLKNMWSPLIGQRTHGCGYNVITFYGYLTEYESREKIACLSLHGTSIFTALAYIIDKTKQYVVMRFPLMYLVNMITNMSENSSNYHNHFIMIKLYRDKYIPNKPHMMSHIGHIVSIYMYVYPSGERSIVFIDPQQQDYRMINDDNELSAFYEALDGIYRFFDIAFVLSGDSPTEVTTPAFLASTYDGELVPFDPFVQQLYGGKKRKTNKPKPKRRKRYSSKSRRIVTKRRC